jgi:hypothetical protein
MSSWSGGFKYVNSCSPAIHNAPFSAKGSWNDRMGRTWVFNPGRQIGPAPAYLILDVGMDRGLGVTGGSSTAATGRGQCSRLIRR